LDHVFNCSVLDPIPHNTVAITDAYYDGLVNRKLKGLFNMTRACIPHLHAGASFVNASSTAGLGPIAWFSVYCAAQYGIIGFSKSLALELGPRGIRTNVVAHGFINTPTNAQNLQQLPGLANYYARISMGRLGEPEEVAEAVVFLMSNDSSYMNGSVMEVSGGIS
jgi:NAD(P)-dependent dehydrogenase (short-subunit alcohol dehydrogenase family)